MNYPELGRYQKRITFFNQKRLKSTPYQKGLKKAIPKNSSKKSIQKRLKFSIFNCNKNLFIYLQQELNLLSFLVSKAKGYSWWCLKEKIK